MRELSLRSAARKSLLFVLLAVLSLPATASAIDEFPVTPGSRPGGIAVGPDGNLWFTQEGQAGVGGSGPGGIGRITPAGAVTNHVLTLSSTSKPDQIVSGSDGRLWFTRAGDNRIGALNPGTGGLDVDRAVGTEPAGITSGPDGALWFTERGSNRIGRVHPSAPTTVTYPVTRPSGSGPSDITVGPDGRIWFTEETAGRVGRINADSTVTSFDRPGADPSGITSGPGGVWFAEFAAGNIGRINTTSGEVSIFPTGGNTGPSAITSARDGALWFTESTSHTIGRITTGGAVTNHFATPTPLSEPSDLVIGPDQAAWFTEHSGDRIGRIVVPAPFVPGNVPPPPPPAAGGSKKSAKKCKVPKLRNLTVKKARKKLRKAGCKFKFRGKGRVKSTLPKAGRTTTKRVIVKCKRTKAKRSGRRAMAGAVQTIAAKGGLQ